MGLRQDRLADQIRDILGRSFQGGQMQDPRLQNIAVTAVKVTGDLQIASVYYRFFGEAEQPAVQAGLERASGFLRNQLADGLDLRRVPNLRFFFDESVEEGARIEQLLANLNQQN